jgi:hypothetical protein
MIYRPNLTAGQFVLTESSGVFMTLVIAGSNSRGRSTRHSLYKVSDEIAKEPQQYCSSGEYYDGTWHFSQEIRQASHIRAVFDNQTEAQNVYDAILAIELLSSKMVGFFTQQIATLTNSETPDTSAIRSATILSKIIELKIAGYDDTMTGAEADFMEKISPHLDELMVIGWMAAD